MSTASCTGALTPALPRKQAPKKSQKGMRQEPQQMPQRSKSALGQADIRNTPQNPQRFMKFTIQILVAVSGSVAWLVSASPSDSTSAISSSSSPATLAA